MDPHQNKLNFLLRKHLKKKTSGNFSHYLRKWTTSPNNSPVFLSERIDQGSLCTYACKRRRDNFRRATLLYHRVRKNQSKLLKLYLIVPKQLHTRILFQYHGPQDLSEIMENVKRRSICIGKVYTAHYCLLLTLFLLELIYSFYFIYSAAFRKLSNVQ